MFTLEKLQNFVTDYLHTSELNRLPETENGLIFEAPLIGTCPAEDAYLQSLKKIISPRYKTPLEWLPEAKSVVSLFLPFSEKVIVSNRTKGEVSKEWMYSRYEGGDILMPALIKDMVKEMEGNFIQTVAPQIDERSEVIDRKSNHSERHTAYRCGLGTFGLHRALITEKGSCGRLFSLITNYDYGDTSKELGLYENCIMCYACIKRCEAGAITKAGKEHSICAGLVNKVLEKYHPRYGCGKCNTAVPCESRNPKQQAS